MIKLYIHPSLETVKPELIYLFRIWAVNQQCPVQFTDVQDDAVVIGNSHDKLDGSGMLTVRQATLNSQSHFIEYKNGLPDYLATAFYMMNCVQELNDKDPDELGRFKFTNSYQHRLHNTKTNTVQQCFHEISKTIGVPVKNRASAFFLTHDIDMVNGAILEDGLYVLKKGRVDIFLAMLLRVAMRKPDWLNMDKIMKLESEYDCKSAFFWLVNKGKINQRERNSDYRFGAAGIQKQFRATQAQGFYNGIHKSISAETFGEEIKKYGSMPVSNRYHYLKFNLPKAYHDIAEAGLKLDASLGFAEEAGFRNNYGLPFNPYNFEARRHFSFVEAPLHVMDRTYFQYKKYPVDKAADDIIDFFERNRENCVLSVLWHNNFFTGYKFNGYLGLYKKILGYIREHDFRTVSPDEIIETYSIP